MPSFSRKYGVQTTIVFPVPKLNDTDFAATGDWTPAEADIKISKDGGNVVNCDNAAAAVGGAGSVLFKLTLTATEMEAAHVTGQIVDAALENSAFTIETYGNASAQHAMDFDTATIVASSVTAGVTLAAGAITNAALAGNMEIVFETDFGTNYNITRNAWETNVQDFVGTTAADPFSGKVVAASVAGAVGSVSGAVGSVSGAVGSVSAGVSLAAGAITNASLAGNMEIVFETDFSTNYNTTRDAWVTNTQDFVGTSAADPFNGKVVAASVTGAVGSVAGNVDGTVASLASVSNIWTTAITEAYATDGAAFTPAQGMYQMWAVLAEANYSSTTMTAKKLGGTTAMTFTLNSATTPTTITRTG